MFWKLILDNPFEGSVCGPSCKEKMKKKCAADDTEHGLAVLNLEPSSCYPADLHRI